MLEHRQIAKQYLLCFGSTHYSLIRRMLISSRMANCAVLGLLNAATVTNHGMVIMTLAMHHMQ